jgi:GTP cyclohydrolase I
MTQQIAEMIVEILQPRGVAVIIEGSHMCSMMRGVKKEHSKMVTKAMIGMFKNDKESRKEFMEHVGKS